MVTAHWAQAQLVSDIFRYSYYENFSTGRSLATGNSLHALGGDPSILTSNPASLATYRYSEFTVSTGFRSFRVESELGDQGVFDDIKNDLVLNNLALVVANNSPTRAWRTANFGIGYNRNTSFDRRAFYQGETRGSITDRWLERAQGFLLNDLLDYESGLAFDADALIELSDGDYTTDYQDGDNRQAIRKRETVQSEGDLGEITFAFGANYKDKLYLGGSFGIPLLNFNMTRLYEEENPDDNSSDFRNLTYTERLNTDGGGINAKLGLTYLFSQSLRWSLHYQSGSRLTVVDEFNNGLEYSYFSEGETKTAAVDFPNDGGSLNFEYSMITPYQLSTGLGIVIGKKGFISAAVDFSDYTHARFEFDPSLSSAGDLAYERELNQSIDSLFTSAFTFRLGGELALEGLRLRAGGVVKQRPFSNDQGLDYGWSTGLGLRINRVFLDFAYRRWVENVNA